MKKMSSELKRIITSACSFLSSPFQIFFGKGVGNVIPSLLVSTYKSYISIAKRKEAI